MANQNPPLKNQAFTLSIGLLDATDNLSFKANPTIAAGDFKISKSGGAFANMATLPAVTPAAGIAVEIPISATEMNTDWVVITGVDQTTPKEWADFFIMISTTA